MMNIARQPRSGRTARMLEEAVALARKGNHVLVIAASGGEGVRHLLSRIRELGGSLIENGVAFGAKGLVIVVPARDVDWSTGNVRGMPYRYANVLADHHAIETNLRWALDQMDRWALPVTGR